MKLTCAGCGKTFDGEIDEHGVWDCGVYEGELFCLVCFPAYSDRPLYGIGPLLNALDDFRDTQETRLREKHREGKRGWDKPRMEGVIQANLIDDLAWLEANGSRYLDWEEGGRTRKKDAEKYQRVLVDIANRAMMLWNLDRRIRSGEVFQFADPEVIE